MAVQTPDDFGDLVQSLTPDGQTAVRRFIDYLKMRRASAGSSPDILQAADAFIAEHPELLRRFAS